MGIWLWLLMKLLEKECKKERIKYCREYEPGELTIDIRENIIEKAIVRQLPEWHNRTIC